MVKEVITGKRQGPKLSPIVQRKSSKEKVNKKFILLLTSQCTSTSFISLEKICETTKKVTIVKRFDYVL